LVDGCTVLYEVFFSPLFLQDSDRNPPPRTVSFSETVLTPPFQFFGLPADVFFLSLKPPSPWCPISALPTSLLISWIPWFLQLRLFCLRKMVGFAGKTERFSPGCCFFSVFASISFWATLIHSLALCLATPLRDSWHHNPRE